MARSSGDRYDERKHRRDLLGKYSEKKGINKPGGLLRLPGAEIDPMAGCEVRPLEPKRTGIYMDRHGFLRDAATGRFVKVDGASSLLALREEGYDDPEVARAAVKYCRDISRTRKAHERAEKQYAKASDSFDLLVAAAGDLDDTARRAGVEGFTADAYDLVGALNEAEGDALEGGLRDVAGHYHDASEHAKDAADKVRGLGGDATAADVLADADASKTKARKALANAAFRLMVAEQTASVRVLLLPVGHPMRATLCEALGVDESTQPSVPEVGCGVQKAEVKPSGPVVVTTEPVFTSVNHRQAWATLNRVLPAERRGEYLNGLRDAEGIGDVTDGAASFAGEGASFVAARFTVHGQPADVEWRTGILDGGDDDEHGAISLREGRRAVLTLRETGESVTIDGDPAKVGAADLVAKLGKQRKSRAFTRALDFRPSKRDFARDTWDSRFFSAADPSGDVVIYDEALRSRGAPGRMHEGAPIRYRLTPDGKLFYARPGRMGGRTDARADVRDEREANELIEARFRNFTYETPAQFAASIKAAREAAEGAEFTPQAPPTADVTSWGIGVGEGDGGALARKRERDMVKSRESVKTVGEEFKAGNGSGSRVKNGKKAADDGW